MEESVCCLYAQGLASSTQRSYKSASSRYLQFCNLAQARPLPLCEHILCLYVTYLSMQQLKHKSIKVYLSALRHFQISAGLPDPFTSSFPRLEYVLKGIKRTQSKSASQDQRLPITPTILRQIRSTWSARAKCPDIKMLWAAFCLGFFGFLRSGEFTIQDEGSFDSTYHLMPGDISVDSHSNPSIMRVLIKASKTDPFRKGTPIYIGATHDDLCPVAAMLAYLAVRPHLSGPLFIFSDGHPLTRSRLVSHLRKALTEAGIDSTHYAGHSFRIGAASTAAAKGIEDSKIKMLGRWESAAYLQYIRTPRESLAAISCTLSAC